MIRICLFSGIDSNVGESRSIFIEIESNSCNRYLLSKSAFSFLTEDNHYLTITQKLLNCARLNIDLSLSNSMILPVWILRSEADRIKEKLELLNNEYPEAHIQPCILEEYLHETIDHSLKPIELLKSFAMKLQSRSAFAKIKVDDRDRAYAKILDFDVEMFEILDYLRQNKFIEYDHLTKRQGYKNIPIKMTIDGWAKIREEKLNQKSKKVFVAMQFEWPDSVPSLSNEVLKSIKDACSSLGYEASIVGQDHTGNITDKIMNEIKSSRFVVAELTYNNRGVYFESGFARGLGLNVFHVIKEGFIAGEDSEGKKIHFDIQQLMYRKWETPEMLKEKLRDWIEATVGRYS